MNVFLVVFVVAIIISVNSEIKVASAFTPRLKPCFCFLASSKAIKTITKFIAAMAHISKKPLFSMLPSWDVKNSSQREADGNYR